MVYPPILWPEVCVGAYLSLVRSESKRPRKISCNPYLESLGACVCTSNGELQGDEILTTNIQSNLAHILPHITSLLVLNFDSGVAGCLS